MEVSDFQRGSQRLWLGDDASVDGIRPTNFVELQLDPTEPQYDPTKEEVVDRSGAALRVLTTQKVREDAAKKKKKL